MEYSDLREGIYNHLVANVAAVGNRVFWGWTAPADSVKPFLTMSFAGELPSATGNKCALLMQLDVEVFGDESNILAIDPVADDVVRALALPVTTPAGRTIQLDYVRDARFDAWSEALRASMIRLKFVLPSDLWV